mgnify:CR=1 FL=1
MQLNSIVSNKIQNLFGYAAISLGDQQRIPKERVGYLQNVPIKLSEFLTQGLRIPV